MYDALVSIQCCNNMADVKLQSRTERTFVIIEWRIQMFKPLVKVWVKTAFWRNTFLKFLISSDKISELKFWKGLFSFRLFKEVIAMHNFFLIVTVRNRSWGKVVFSQACIIPSVHGGRGVVDTPPGRQPTGQTTLGQTPPPGRQPPDRHPMQTPLFRHPPPPLPHQRDGHWILSISIR